MTRATNWAPAVRYSILRGSSEWMAEMAWVVDIDGAHVVIRATIEPSTLALATVVRMFLGRVVSDNPDYPVVSIYGSYDPSFRQPSWLVLEQV